MAKASPDPRGGWSFELDDGSTKWAAGPSADAYAAELGAALGAMPDERTAGVDPVATYQSMLSPQQPAPPPVATDAPRGRPAPIPMYAPGDPMPGMPEPEPVKPTLSQQFASEVTRATGGALPERMPAGTSPVRGMSADPSDYAFADGGGSAQEQSAPPAGGGGSAIRIPGGRQTASWNMQYRQTPEEAREAMLGGVDAQSWAEQMRLQNQAKFTAQEVEQAKATDQAVQYQRELIARKQEEREQKLAERRDVMRQAQEEAAGMDVSEESYWREKGTGSRVLAAIAMAGGAFASGMNGAPNYAMQIIESQIERNIQAQRERKASAGKAADEMKWGYEELRNQFGSEHEADLAMHASYLSSVESAAKRRAAIAENENTAAGLMEVAGLAEAKRGQIMAELDSVAISQQDVNVPDQIVMTGGSGGAGSKLDAKAEEEARKGAANFLKDSTDDIEASESLEQYRARLASNPSQSGTTGFSGAVSRVAAGAGVDDILLPEETQENRRVRDTAVLNIAKSRYGTASDRTLKMVAPTVGTSTEAQRNWVEGQQKIVDAKVMSRLRNEPDHVRQQILNTNPTARKIWERHQGGKPTSFRGAGE